MFREHVDGRALGKQAAWRSILNGPVRNRARDVVRRIAEALLRLDPEEVTRSGSPNPSLSSGTAGMALFFRYLSEEEADRKYVHAACVFLNHAASKLAHTPLGPQLFQGFTGIAWTVAHMQRHGVNGSAFDLSEVDSALTEYVSVGPWRGSYDLIGGLVGIGVYALERLPEPSAVGCLEHVIERLAELAERTPQGASWFTPPDQLPGPYRDASPQGHYNLGVAHGVPAVLALLSHAAAAGIRREDARSLTEDGVRWLLAQRLPHEHGSWFPVWVGPGVEPARSRCAWCYGDPGIASCLLQVSELSGLSDVRRVAVAMALDSTRRPVADTGVRDASLCHGAAGLSHLFNRMYQATGDLTLLRAATAWLERTMEMQQLGRGFAGYEYYVPNGSFPRSSAAEPGFLEGAVGVGLALLAAASSVPPEWDRTLLCNIRPLSQTASLLQVGP